MTDTSIDQNVYLTNGSVSGDTITTTGSQKVVKIVIDNQSGSIDYDFSNDVIIIDPFVLSDEETPISYIKNLLTIKESVRVSGLFIEESSSSALSKRQDFGTLLKHRGEITLVWGKSSDGQQQKYVGFVLKGVIRERNTGQIVTQTKTIANTDYERNFFVDFNLVISEEL